MDRREVLRRSALMLGVTASGATVASLFQACKDQPRLSWKPVFFDQAQALLMSEISETILPKTGTPGAKDLKVDIFVDLIISEAFSDGDKAHIKNTIKDFEAICQESAGESFVKMSAEDRKKALQKAEKDAATFNPVIWGSTLGEQKPINFYRRVKQLTLLGYFTSEHVGKKMLSYDPMPGKFIPCMPLKDVGNTWTL